MKHIIIFLIFLFCSSVFAQNTDKNSTNISEGQIFYNVYETTGELLRIKIVSGTVTTNPSSSTNSYAAWLSTGSTVDTIVFGFTPRVITVILDEPITDTLFVAGSDDGDFAATTTIRRLGTEGFTKAWATDTLFIKVGANITISQNVRIEAN